MKTAAPLAIDVSRQRKHQVCECFQLHFSDSLTIYIPSFLTICPPVFFFMHAIDGGQWWFLLDGAKGLKKIEHPCKLFSPWITQSNSPLCLGNLHCPCFLHAPYVSVLEKKGQFGPDLNIEILICSESRKNKLFFNACFMFVATWIHFLWVFIYATLANRETEKTTLKN